MLYQKPALRSDKVRFYNLCNILLLCWSTPLILKANMVKSMPISLIEGTLSLF